MSDTIFNGTNGNDIFNGGAGADLVTFAGNASDYRIETLEDGRIQVTDLNKRDGYTGVDILTGIETLSFADKNYTLDASLSSGPQGEFRINTTTASDQTAPAITALANGGFILTWSSDGQDGSSYGIYSQRYDALGNKVGGETQVNTETIFRQENPVVTSLSNGGYIIAWESWYHGFGGPDEDNMNGVFLQRYDADGNKVGGEIHANTFTAEKQVDAGVTELKDGGFVVTWSSITQEGPEDPFHYGVYAQRFDANGNKVGGEVHVNTYTDNAQTESFVAALDDGGYLIAWASYGQDGHDGFGVYTQRYDANGDAVGGETLINTETFSWQNNPSISVLSDGGYVIAWQSILQEGGNDFGIYAQRFDANGDPVGAETHINTTTTNSERAPMVAALKDGGYVIVWQSGIDNDGQDGNIYAQRFDVDGNRDGGETLINDVSLNSHIDPSITALKDGGYVISWESTDDVNGFGNGEIYARRFDADGHPWGAGMLEINGTATADTLNAGKGNQLLQGLGGNDTLIGGSGLDSLIGGNGADLLIGGQGRDQLKGGLGADLFRFQDALSSGFDRVRDFDSSDILQLDHHVYTQLAVGNLNAGNFVANATGTPMDGNDYLVYNSSTGDLFYDSNGSAAGGSTLIAKFTGVPALTVGDFEVI